MSIRNVFDMDTSEWVEVRKGWAVAIKRKDGSEFLACSNPGILPAVFLDRSYAVKHKRELQAENFTCRVVRCEFTTPVPTS